MILEYFYIKKYVTTFSWLLLVKDIFVGIVAVCTCLNTLAYLFKDRKQVVLATRKKKKRVTVLQIYYSMLVMSFTIASILRVGGACYQYITKELARPCFTVENGAILQTPFTLECMRVVDNFIIFLTGLPLFFFGCSVLVSLFMACVLLYSDRKYGICSKDKRYVLNKRYFLCMLDIHGSLMVGFFVHVGRQICSFFGNLSQIFRRINCAKKTKERKDEQLLSSVVQETHLCFNDEFNNNYLFVCYETAL